MKHLSLLIFLIAISFCACRKDIPTKPCINNSNPFTSIIDDFDYAADEAQFLADDTEGDDDTENAYSPEGATPMKITGAYCIDSIAPLNSTGKKNKNAKRALFYSCKKTKFTLSGYGFKSQSDTSRVIPIITKTKDTLHDATILTWSDNKITIEVNNLDATKYPIDTKISLKFKVFRSNDKLNKAAVSRVKSRAAISVNCAIRNDTISFSDSTITLNTLINSILQRRQPYHSFNYWISTQTWKCASYTIPSQPVYFPCYQYAQKFSDTYHGHYIGSIFENADLKRGMVVCNKNYASQGQSYDYKMVERILPRYNTAVDATGRPTCRVILYDPERGDTVSYHYHADLTAAMQNNGYPYMMTEYSSRAQGTQKTVRYFINE